MRFLAEEQTCLIDERLATKDDLERLELRLTLRLGTMMPPPLPLSPHWSSCSDVFDLAGRDLVTKEYLDSRLTQIEQRMTIKLGTLMVVGCGRGGGTRQTILIAPVDSQGLKRPPSGGRFHCIIPGIAGSAQGALHADHQHVLRDSGLNVLPG